MHWAVAAEDMIAEKDLVPYARSAMDGYALRAADSALASPQSPSAFQSPAKSALSGTQNSLELVGECNHGFQPIVLDDPLADIASPLPALPVKSGEPLETMPMRPGKMAKVFLCTPFCAPLS